MLPSWRGLFEMFIGGLDDGWWDCVGAVVERGTRHTLF